MLCDKCKVNPASISILKVINGVKQEMSLCQSCAKSAEGFAIPGNIKMESPFTFQNVLCGLVDYINQSSSTVRSVDSVCSKCGMSYAEFKQSGVMGCSNCYKSFSPAIIPIVKRVHGNTEHVGKIPLKSGKEIMERKRMLGLKEELQKAVLAEEFEKAAELRDKIREIQGNDKEV